MALSLLSSVPITSFIPNHTKAIDLRNPSVLRAPRSVVAMANVSDQKAGSRRSANYQPSIWPYDYIQSLKSNYKAYIYICIVVTLKFDEGSSTMKILCLVGLKPVSYMP
ncbi:hypothetical protein V6N13_078853 [Hibiscus sabdariffa]